MSRDKELMENDSQQLEFEEATQLTIEETLQKDEDLQAGITDQDGVLDKYIKKHRAEVGEQKFANKIDQLDTQALDDFIKKQRASLAERREALENAELAAASLVAAAGGAAIKSASDAAQSVEEQAGEIGSAVPTKTIEPATDSAVESAADIFAQEKLLDDSSVLDEKPKKSKKFLIGGAAALILGVVGLGYGLNQLNQSALPTDTETAQSSASDATKEETATQPAAKEDLEAFDQLYASFFADEEATKPKNSEFGNIAALEEALAKLEGTSDYEAAKSKVDALVKTIAAIEAINEKFETPAIVDGEKVEAVLKEGANLDDLSSDILNTGKASLDTLIQAVVAESRGLIAAGGGSLTGGTAPVAETPTPADPSAPAAEAVASAPVQEAVQPAPAATTEAPVVAAPVQSLPAGHIQAPTNYGLISYDPSTLQRQLSRVPFNFELIADTANPAWAFNPGVMEEIIRVSQQRGYITGYNFILEPVNIVNGNGYYNMYKPDGTYLFSINAKTGYFVGNAPGYAEDLDY